MDSIIVKPAKSIIHKQLKVVLGTFVLFLVLLLSCVLLEWIIYKKLFFSKINTEVFFFIFIGLILHTTLLVSSIWFFKKHSYYIAELSSCYQLSLLNNKKLKIASLKSKFKWEIYLEDIQTIGIMHNYRGVKIVSEVGDSLVFGTLLGKEQVIIAIDAVNDFLSKFNTEI